uniref:Uncharacterized protein n=1 Tax=Onchocerca volvulus TaxID=6282 RepID=A0A8R1XT89_ONCVO
MEKISINPTKFHKIFRKVEHMKVFTVHISKHMKTLQSRCFERSRCLEVRRIKIKIISATNITDTFSLHFNREPNINKNS